MASGSICFDLSWILTHYCKPLKWYLWFLSSGIQKTKMVRCTSATSSIDSGDTREKGTYTLYQTISRLNTKDSLLRKQVRDCQRLKYPPVFPALKHLCLSFYYPVFFSLYPFPLKIVTHTRAARQRERERERERKGFSEGTNSYSVQKQWTHKKRLFCMRVLGFFPYFVCRYFRTKTWM